jgi:hypothetical protein
VDGLERRRSRNIAGLVPASFVQDYSFVQDIGALVALFFKGICFWEWEERRIEWEEQRIEWEEQRIEFFDDSCLSNGRIIEGGAVMVRKKMELQRVAPVGGVRKDYQTDERVVFALPHVLHWALPHHELRDSTGQLVTHHKMSFTRGGKTYVFSIASLDKSVALPWTAMDRMLLHYAVTIAHITESQTVHIKNPLEFFKRHQYAANGENYRGFHASWRRLASLSMQCQVLAETGMTIKNVPIFDEASAAVEWPLPAGYTDETGIQYFVRFSDAFFEEVKKAQPLNLDLLLRVRRSPKGMDMAGLLSWIGYVAAVRGEKQRVEWSEILDRLGAADKDKVSLKRDYKALLKDLTKVTGYFIEWETARYDRGFWIHPPESMELLVQPTKPLKPRRPKHSGDQPPLDFGSRVYRQRKGRQTTYADAGPMPNRRKAMADVDARRQMPTYGKTGTSYDIEDLKRRVEDKRREWRINEGAKRGLAPADSVNLRIPPELESVFIGAAEKEFKDAIIKNRREGK